MKLATAWSRRVTGDLTGVWHHGDRVCQLPMASFSACPVALCAAAVTFSIGPANDTTPQALISVPPDQLPAINGAAQSCRALAPPRLAAQIMAASAFDPRTTAVDGGTGSAGLTDGVWRDVTGNKCTGAGNQAWTLGTDGTVRVQGKYLVSPGTTNSTPAQLGRRTGAPDQQSPAQTNDALVNVAAQRCLDATDKSSANGTPRQLWDRWGTENQFWTLR